MKILITGATGFIGIRIIDALLAGGHEIFALCRNLEKAKAKLPDKPYQYLHNNQTTIFYQ